MQSCYRQVRELADHIHRTTKKGCRSSAITSANAPAMNTACQTRSRFRNWRPPDLGGKQTTSTVSRCQTDEPVGCQHMLHSSVAWAQPCGSWHSRGQKTGYDSSGTIEAPRPCSRREASEDSGPAADLQVSASFNMAAARPPQRARAIGASLTRSNSYSGRPSRSAQAVATAELGAPVPGTVAQPPLSMINRRSHNDALLNSVNFPGASGCCRNLSTQIGASTSTTAACARSFAICSAVPPKVHPKREKPSIDIAAAPITAPQIPGFKLGGSVMSCAPFSAPLWSVAGRSALFVSRAIRATTYAKGSGFSLDYRYRSCWALAPLRRDSR